MKVPYQNPKILIVGPSWVGDMVMTQSICAALSQRYNAPQIDILAPEWSAPVISRMPEVNQSIASPLKHKQIALRQRYLIGKALRKNHYHQAIVVPGSWKSAIIPWVAAIPVRTGFLGEQRYGILNDHHQLDKNHLPTMLQRYLYLATLTVTKTPSSNHYPKLLAHDADQALQRFNLSLKKCKPVLALCPGAEFGGSKQWPLEYYAKIAMHQLNQGWQVWLFGSAKDQCTTAKINQLCQDACIDLAGKTKLGDAIDLLSMVDLVVTNDSGLMHVACALDRKVIAIYGSSSADHTPPLSENAKVLSLKLPCQPCFKRDCPLGHFACMKQLKPDQVLSQIRVMFEEKSLITE